MNRRLFISGAIAILVVSVGVVWLRAAPTIGATSVTPTVVGVNTPTQVTVTAQISDSTLIPASVNLLRVDATGRTLANLGAMYDDGTNGDAIAGDKTFSLAITINQATPEQIHLQASAAFRGTPKRTLSEKTTLSIWETYTSSGAEITFAVPPDLTVASRTRSDGATEVYAFSADSRDSVPLFAIQAVVTGGGVSVEEFALSRIDADAIYSSTTVGSGLLVVADSIPSYHYFGLNAQRQRGVQIYGPDRAFFTSPEFFGMLSTMRF